MDRFCKTCLVLIVLLLSVTVLRPLIALQSVNAAQPRQYTYVGYGLANLTKMETDLNAYSKQGWEVVGVTTIGQYGNQVLVIMAK